MAFRPPSGGGGGADTALSNLAAVAINTSLISDTDNTDALGSSSVGWSDLFLGDGGVIDWNDGDATITHSSEKLSIASNFLVSGATATSGTPDEALDITGGSHTGLDNAIFFDARLNFGGTASFTGGGADINTGLSTVRIDARTYTAAAAQNVVGISGLSIDGPQVSGTNLSAQFYQVGLELLGFESNSPGANGAVSLIQPSIADGRGAVGTVTGIGMVNQGSSVSLGNQTATLTNLASMYFEAIDFTSTTNTRTVTNMATIYIAGPHTAGTNVTATNGPYSIFVDAGLNRFDGDGTHVFELPADATDPTGGGGAATGRIPVTIGGATRYIAYY